MNCLYISDLDGTLLNQDTKLSPYTIKTLNSLLEQGLLFTVATARTAATVSTLLAPLNLSIPVILMNGVIIYHLTDKKYIKVHTLPKKTVLQVIDILNQYNLKPFIYEAKSDELTAYYESFKNKTMKEFYEERANCEGKKFVKLDNFSHMDTDNIIYFSLLDTKEALEPVYNILSQNPLLSVAFYKDIYTTEDIWYLEIFSVHGSKYNGAKFLREEYGFDRLIGFGDNLNDIPLFKACEEACAVENGKEEVKQIATHRIGSNNEDGVARFIKEHYTP